jgi:hypothetical protein
MVPGAYWPWNITVSRGIGLTPPWKKFGPPPKTSRESKNSARAIAVLASDATAAIPKAIDRFISIP